MISLGALIQVVVWLVVVGLICWLLLWLVNYCGLPEPFHKIATVLIAVVAVLIVISVLLPLAGVQVFKP